MKFVARYYRAGAAYDSGNANEALRLLDDLDATTPDLYRSLRAQLLWERSRIVGRQGDLYGSLSLSMRAAVQFDELGEWMNATRMRMATATSLAALGRMREAWKLQPAIFRIVGERGSEADMERALSTLALSEAATENLEVAASLFDVQLASGRHLPLLQFEARLWRTLISIRRREDKFPKLSALHQAAMTIDDPDQRSTALDDFRFVQAITELDATPLHSIELLSETIEYRRKTRLTHHLPEAYIQRARAFVKTGDLDGAISDLNDALDQLEENRRRIVAVDLRDTFFSWADAACQELLAIHASRHDAERAFDAAERCRARGLVDSAMGKAAPADALPIAEIQRSLPSGTVLLHVSCGTESTVVFALTRDSLAMHLLPLRRAEFDVPEGAASFARSSRFFQPIAHHLRRADIVILVPDDTFAYVPLAPILREAGVPLVRTAVAPSASYYARRTDRSPLAGTSAVVVGDPTFDRSLFPGVERLPQAAAEALDVAAIYPASLLLTQDSATQARLLDAMPDADIIHIATHAITSSADATASVLLLSSEDKSPGVLYPRQISALRLKRSPFVVLAGCKTARPGPGRGSIRGFAASFLAAGSRGVIATSWDVDDSETRAFSRALHRRIRAGRHPIDALHDLQMEMITSGDPRRNRPEVWGAFQYYGLP